MDDREAIAKKTISRLERFRDRRATAQRLIALGASALVIEKLTSLPQALIERLQKRK